MVTTATNKTNARIAGLLYLMVILTGLFSLMYVPEKLIVEGNVAETLQNIASSQMLYRLGIVSGLTCYTFFLFLPLILYKLFRPVNENIAKVMVILALMSVPIYFINVQNQFTVLSLIKGTENFNGFSVEQLHSQVLLSLTQYENGMRTIHIFSGLWLFPFGYLLYKSGFLPKILGVLLMLGCFGYLINFVGNTLSPAYSQMGLSTFISLPASIGEIVTCLWLLIMGAKNTDATLK